jgi:fructose-bisphosphate aldolase class II
LSKVSPNFTIAASFGNVHGVYKPGNVKLTPKILKNSQDYIKEKHGTEDHPVDFVFHGGSGSSQEEIREAISYGVIKMNIDTDTQWAFWDGIRAYASKKTAAIFKDKLETPKVTTNQTKRNTIHEFGYAKLKKSMVERLKQAYDDLNALNKN